MRNNYTLFSDDKNKLKLPIRFGLFFWVLLLYAISSGAQVSFQSNTATSVGKTFAQYVDVGDLNNDGRNDVALATGYYFDPVNDYSLFVFLQSSSGTLGTPVQYRYPTSYPGLTGIDIDDFNNDGLQDVVISYGDSIGIYFQNGSGSMNAIKGYLCKNANGLKADDLNNDGLADIAVLSDSVRVFYQQTNGSFVKKGYAPGGGEIEIGDVNNDGLNDIICSSSGIKVYTQTNAGILNPPVTYTFGSLRGIAVGDLNNDGKLDVVGTSGGNKPNSKINIWFQDSNTGLLSASPTVIDAYDIPEPIEIVDLNCDGKMEIITLNGGWNAMTTYSQNGSGQYTTYQKFSVPYASHYKVQGLAFGDINSDGRNDAVIADYNHGLVTLINSSNCGLQPLSGTMLGTDATCQNKNDGSATVTPSGGTSPYKYLWNTAPSQTTQTATGLSVGTYTVTITDDSAKTKTVQVIISGPTPANVSVAISASSNNVCADNITFTAAQTNGGGNPVYQWKVNGNTQGANSSSFESSTLNKGDVVTCEMTSSLGCFTPLPAVSNPITLLEIKSNTAGLISSVPDTICPNATAYLTTTGSYGNKFRWQTGNNAGSMNDIAGADTNFYTTPPLSQSTYYRLLVGTGKCADTSSLFAIQVSPVPEVSFSASSSGLKISFKSVVVSGSVINYLWDFGDGHTGSSKDVEHIFNTAGTYYVCLTAYNSTDCSYTKCNSFDVSATSGVQEISESQNWHLYPNPFNNAFYIQGESENIPVEQISIYDVLGRQVKKLERLTADKMPLKLNMAEVPEGMYYVQVKAGNKMYTLPVVKTN